MCVSEDISSISRASRLNHVIHAVEIVETPTKPNFIRRLQITCLAETLCLGVDPTCLHEFG
jgi:hypothetical protein